MLPELPVYQNTGKEGRALGSSLFQYTFNTGKTVKLEKNLQPQKTIFEFFTPVIFVCGLIVCIASVVTAQTVRTQQNSQHVCLWYNTVKQISFLYPAYELKPADCH